MPRFSPVFIIWVHPFGHCQDAYALLIKGMGGFITIWAAPPRGIAIWRSTSVSLQLPRVEHRPGCKVRLLQLTAFECWFHFVLGATTWNMLKNIHADGERLGMEDRNMIPLKFTNEPRDKPYMGRIDN